MAYSSFEDNNVLFLQGTQTSLNSLITNGGAKEGAFYLTYDTHRLYVGRNNGSKVIPVAVNEGVTTVSSLDDLTSITTVNAGEFYYIEGSNILCVYNGTKFVQINSDTNTTNKSLAYNASVSSNTANVTTTLTDSDSKSVSGNFSIKDSSGHTVITVSGTVIDLKADEYSLNSSVTEENNADVATLTLNSANTTEDTAVKVYAGQNIAIESKDDGFEISSSYHNTTNKSLDSVLTSEGKIKVTVTDSDGNSVFNESEAITYSVNNINYIPGSELPVYTKEQIDNLLNGLNGMTYMGTVGSTTALPSSGVKAGDTYLVADDGVISITASQAYDGVAVSAGKGDLLIATGTEVNGIIASDLKWSYIPAGDDSELDTTYTWISSSSDNKKILQDSNNGVKGSWQLVEGTAIDITSTDTGNNLVTTIAHADVTNTTSTGTEQNNVASLNVITGIDVNNQGHVTNVETTKFNLKDTTYALNGAEVSTITNGIKIVDTLTGSTGATSTSILSVTSETLSLEKGTNAYSIDLKWGSF